MATPKNRSVMKAFSLLRSFRQPDEWLTSSELSRRAKLPEASGYRLVQTLEGIGAVVRDARGRYRPGMLLLALSQDIVARDLWHRVPQHLLTDVAARLGVRVHVGVFEDDMVTYVACAGKQVPGMIVTAGMQFEGYCTAIGKVLLAALSSERLDEFLAGGEFVPLTARTLVDRAMLRANLDHVSLRGFSIDDGETLDTIRCIAAPICNPAGVVVAAVSLCDEADRMNEQRQQDLLGELFGVASAVADRLFPWRDATAASVVRTTDDPVPQAVASGGRW